MDNSYSKHMTGKMENFLSFKAHEEGNVSIGNGKKGYIPGIGKVGKNLSQTIDDVYYVDGPKYSLLSVDQICDKGNKVCFMSNKCVVTSLKDDGQIKIKNMMLQILDHVTPKISHASVFKMM